MRATTLFLTSALAALAAAADGTTTVSFLNAHVSGTLGADLALYTSFVGEVYAADATATTYHVRCEDGAPLTECAINSDTPWTFIQGPETYSADIKDTIETGGASAFITANVACSFTHTSESVSCSQTISLELSAAGESSAYSTNIPSTSIPASEIAYETIKVTGDLAVFSQAASATAPVTASSTGGAQPMITAAPLAAAAAAAIAALL